MATIANAVSLQINFDTRMNEETTFLESIAGLQLSEHELQSRLNEIEYEFSLVRDRHDKIFLSKSQEASKKYLDENVFSTLRNKYHKLWGMISNRLPKPSTSHDVFNSTTVPQCNKTITELSLPKIPLPTFSGKYDEWMEFNNMFTATVHNNPNIEPIVKLQRLKTSVTGSAGLLIRNLELNDNNYAVARKLLSNRYHHTRRLVNAYLRKLYNIPVIKTESAKSLFSMLNDLNDCTEALKQLGLPTEDYQLVYHMCTKLPQTVCTAWERSQGKSTDLPKYEDFLDFLETRLRTMEMVEPTVQSSKSFLVNSNKSSVKPNPKKTSDFKERVVKNQSCVLCNANHSLGKCEKFTIMQQQIRYDTVKRLNLCVNCLSKSHGTRNCWSKIGCRVCNKRHHTLLHKYTINPQSNDQHQQIPLQHNQGSSQQQNQGSSHQQHQGIPRLTNFHINSQEQLGTVLGTAQVKAISYDGTATILRALVDPCSEDNYILSSTVQALQLQKYYCPSIIGVLGEDHASDCSYRVNLKIKSMDDKFYMKISAGVMEKITSNLPTVPLPVEAFGYLNSVSLADRTFNEPSSIHLLLGVGVHAKIMLGEYNRLGEKLIAENTLLGYLIRGQISLPSERSSLVMMTQSSTIDLNSQIKQFWEIEELESKIPLHPDDDLCNKIFESTVHQNNDGFLTMDLPFKGNEDPFIGPSRYMAVKRFLSLERKLTANPKLKEEYHKTINNYLESNHLAKSSHATEHGYYLPHHAVIKESSTTTKVRVVFDASCKSLDGTSLNDHLLTGPKLQRDIREVVFNWRQYPFAITADIEKMYRMFFINSKHHNFQKIVWRFKETEPIEDYVLRTATFGTSCAPFLAIRSLHHIADLHKVSNPLAAHAIQNEFYVDDFISGGFSIQETSAKQTQVRDILKKYNLILRKWSSNDNRTLSNVPTALLDMAKDLSFDETEFRKTLGIFWSQKTDSFFFSIVLPNDMNGSFTKRQILSLIARLYDPLGWVSPCTMIAKQIMQKIWQTKSGWDEVVDSSILNQFNDFLFQLPSLKEFSIPRWTHITDDMSALTIFGFSDASDKGYSAVVYLLDPTATCSESRLVLLTSKTKVADLKYQSTARLELNGALLLSNLLKWTVGLYKPRPVEVNAFCDSKIVLAWLQGHPSKWKTYIANRTSQILEWMEPAQWNYIDTSINPADCASRGMLPHDLVNHRLWLNGPNLSDLQYNTQCPLDSEQQKILDETVKKNSLILHARRSFPFPLLTYFSNHRRMVKRFNTITEYFKRILQKRLVNKSMNSEKFQKILLNIESAETLIFRLLQSDCFYDEVSCLHNGKELKVNSKLRGLHPFLDGNGILRVGGRLQNAELTFDEIHPIILPSKHQIVVNLISDAHESTLHGTEQLTQAYLRNRFHIPRMSEKVRNFIHGCFKCFKYSKQQQEVLMGSLPSVRVNFTLPFQHAGVDYAGPITVKAYAGRCKKFLKSYVAIFICLCTKAVHIELVSDLTSMSFLAAFKRFSARRGRCHRLYSDNGTNFVGANKILQTDVKLAEQTWKTELTTNFTESGTEWHFIPPATPHFGGLWEAGVKSMKNHLKKTVGTSLLTFEELTTVLTQIEAVLNSRPLCPLSNNPNEYSFLTPAHFLVGRSLVAPPEKNLDLDGKGFLHRWQHVQAIQQRFAKLWRQDYLRNLQNRPKGVTTTIHYKTGDLVLLMDDDTPPTIWPTVIIEETHPGKDGIVRVVTLRTPSGKTFKRPVAKLRYLPCNTPLDL